MGPPLAGSAALLSRLSRSSPQEDDAERPAALRREGLLVVQVGCAVLPWLGPLPACRAGRCLIVPQHLGARCKSWGLYLREASPPTQLPSQLRAVWPSCWGGCQVSPHSSCQPGDAGQHGNGQSGGLSLFVQPVRVLKGCGGRERPAAAAPQGRRGAKGGSQMSLLCSFALDCAASVVLPVPHLLSLPNRFQQHRVCNRLSL